MALAYSDYSHDGMNLLEVAKGDGTATKLPRGYSEIDRIGFYLSQALRHIHAAAGVVPVRPGEVLHRRSK